MIFYGSVETTDILATILCNLATPPHHAFWQIRGI
jgi:hypothetical protein